MPLQVLMALVMKLDDQAAVGEGGRFVPELGRTHSGMTGADHPVSPDGKHNGPSAMLVGDAALLDRIASRAEAREEHPGVHHVDVCTGNGFLRVRGADFDGNLAPADAAGEQREEGEGGEWEGVLHAALRGGFCSAMESPGRPAGSRKIQGTRRRVRGQVAVRRGGRDAVQGPGPCNPDAEEGEAGRREGEEQGSEARPWHLRFVCPALLAASSPFEAMN